MSRSRSAAASFSPSFGRNGRGKTTLLRGLLGLQRWSSGRSEVDGDDRVRAAGHRDAFAYSVLDVVLMGRARQLSSSASSPVDYAAARAALATLGMADSRRAGSTRSAAANVSS